LALFNQTRLTNNALRLDIEGIRRGIYSDRYFENIVHLLAEAAASGYTFAGKSSRPLPDDAGPIDISEMYVEAQIFPRREPYALVGGVDIALCLLRHCTGYWENDRFVETWQHLDVEAVEDGELAPYGGNAEDVRPVLKIRGRYRDFALLETPILGVLSRLSRIATNVYEVMKAANGKSVLYFPARFDLAETQAYDGYAYWLGVQRYNHESGKRVAPIVSTNAHGLLWGGLGTGTIPHSLTAVFLGDTAEATLAFARFLPLDVLRIALVDFNNDSARDAVATLNAFWPLYLQAWRDGDIEGQRRWTLDGVRIDTSGDLSDAGLGPGAGKGVTPALVRHVRAALDNAWQSWDLREDETELARAYCRNTRIVVSGGFNRDRIEHFEREGAPVDAYGVGSTFLRNDSETNTDFTMDVVRVRIAGQWVDMAKVGRRACDNPDLRPVDLSSL